MCPSLKTPDVASSTKAFFFFNDMNEIAHKQEEVFLTGLEAGQCWTKAAHSASREASVQVHRWCHTQGGKGSGLFTLRRANPILTPLLSGDTLLQGHHART